MSFWKDADVLVTGAQGFVGRNLLPKLTQMGGRIFSFSIDEFDLTHEEDVARLFDAAQPTIVIHLAADVGGIGYMRDHAGSVFYNNVMMNTLVLEHARRHSVDKIVTVSSVNCYPSGGEVPFTEEQLWDGRTDDNVLGYGMSKRMMLLQAELYKRQYGLASVNLVSDSIYGPHDIFEEGKSRVIPANILRCLRAKEDGAKRITVWGTGRPERDFIYVDDAVEAIITLAEKVEDPEPINIGTGSTITIRELIELIAELTGFIGDIEWDDEKPDGQLKRHLDATRAKELGFETKVPYREGISKTIDWYGSLDTTRRSS